MLVYNRPKVPLSRVVRAIVLSGAAALLFRSHVFVEFEPVRVKVVQASVAAEAGVVRVNTVAFPQTARLQPPFALIARLTSRSARADSFQVSVDGRPACERIVDGGRSRRIDCAITGAWTAAVDHEVVIRGPSIEWTLDYLELATHHGNTTGAAVLFILPRSSEHFGQPTVGWTLWTWLALMVMLLPSVPSWSGWIQPLFRTVAGVVVILLTIIQCSQWISSYRIVLSAGTFTRSLIVLFAPQVWAASRWLLRGNVPSASRWATLGRSSLVALLVLVAYDSIVRSRLQDDYGGSYSGFLLVSKERFDANPLMHDRGVIRSSLDLLDGAGYDGQFMYFATFDPFLRAYRSTPAQYSLVVDAPPYRYGRIGFSLLTWLFSVGHWQRYPATMVWLILWSLFATALIVAVMAIDRGKSPAYALLVLLIPGFWQSVQVGLPEPVAAATFLGGLFCCARHKWVGGAALFALSLLVRETGIVALGCVVVAGMRSEHRREVFRVGVIAVGLLLIWRLYLGWILFPVWGLQGFLFRPDDLGWPFAGFLDLWRVIARGQYYPWMPEMARAGIVYPLLLIFGLALAVTLAVVSRTAVNLAALLYGVIAVSLSLPMIWAHVRNGQRGTYELFVVLLLSSLSIDTYPPIVRRGVVVFWCCAAIYVFAGAFDAADIRSGLTSR